MREANGKSRRALVLGRGASGEAAATELRRLGYDVEFAEDLALVVASPGVPVKSELQLGCEELRRRGWKLLAVTGSKGKSSVVKVVADALALAGLKAVPCGNYGRPVCDLAREEGPGWAVVEVSSFQLETTQLAGETFEAAVVLNVQEEHLDRHGDMSVYRSLKHRLAAMASVCFEGLETKTPEELEAVQWFAGFRSLIAGSYFDNDILRTNGACAVALMREAGLSDEQIRRGFESFVPLPHRFQTIAEIDGVRYVDDSKATSIAALVAGVTMCGASPVRLIAGGLPKGDDPKNALPILTDRVKKVYLIGQSAEVFSSAWSEAVDCEVCGTLERAVGGAMRDAVKGEAVLLSPGAASFDQFTSFGERGEVFASLVKKGKKRMKKFGMVLGAAAIAAIAGCKDPNYKRAGEPAGQNDVKNADTTVAPPVAQTTAPAPKNCTCAPGTVHKQPCACGGANCFCVVEQKPVPPVQPMQSAKPVEPVPETSIYVVQSGDYLAKISKKFNVTIAAIKKANNMTNDVVRVGQKLKIPGKVDVGAVTAQAGAAPVPARKSTAVFAPYAGATKEYVVKSGDTLGAIAYGNGITIRQLKELNGLTNDVVRVGQKLKIPAEKQVKTAAAKKGDKSAVKPAAEKKALAADKSAANEKPVVEKPAEDKPVETPVEQPPAEVKSAEDKPAETASAPAPATSTYVVQEGDDMTGVSIRWGVSAAEIRELNNLGENDQLRPGQIIKLPAEAQQ